MAHLCMAEGACSEENAGVQCPSDTLAPCTSVPCVWRPVQHTHQGGQRSVVVLEDSNPPSERLPSIGVSGSGCMFNIFCIPAEFVLRAFRILMHIFSLIFTSLCEIGSSEIAFIMQEANLAPGS